MTDQVQIIKERVSIVDIVGQYVKLTKAGKNYKGLSPFKKEKTPSFYVSPDKNMYYDFSSGQGGDIFTFVQQMEGLDFRGALTMLADRAGVELKRENKGDRDARERLYGALEDACTFYETKLTEEPRAQQYLHKRSLEDATMRSFRVGYAPDAWDTLRNHLESKGYRMAELEQAGLVKKSDKGSFYDRFRSRIMFPIMDPAGRVVAFSGRIFGEAAKDDKNAKYLNSPETPLFEKGRILYGYHTAKQFIRKYDFSILVEGQMDIVMSHQAGYANTVAVSGTGLTNDHLTLLHRLSKRLVMAFDADAAGIASSGRAAALALKRGMDVKVVRVPIGKDPADCIKEDPAQWKAAVKQAAHIVDFYLDVVMREHKEGDGDERQLILSVRDTVLPFVARIQSGVDQALFVRKIANTLNIAEESVWQDVHTIAHSLSQDEQAVPESRQTVQPTHPAQTAPTNRTQELERTLAGFLYHQESCEPRILEEEHLRTQAEKLAVPLAPILARYSNERDTLSLHAEITYADTDNPHTLLDTLLTQLAREYRLAERDELAKALREAERAHDDEKAATLLQRFNEVSQSIETLVDDA